jgi:acetyl esterase/lipase
MKTHSPLTLLLLLLLATDLPAADKPNEPARGGQRARADRPARTTDLTDTPVRAETRLYRKTPEGELFLHLYFPPDWKQSDTRPAIIFFFGGAWRTGSFEQFVPQAKYFAARGLVAAAADYRINTKHGTTPDKAIEDAKSAIRWLRSHATDLGIDREKIIAAGGSAGGHLAAATALLGDFDAPDADPKISCRPSALVLFNPVLNLSNIPERAGALAGDAAMRKRLSPTLGLRKEAPPAILFYGADDRFLPQGEEYATKAKALGVRADLFIAPSAGHGFFNRSPWTETTAHKADEFLVSLGYLKDSPTIKLPENPPQLQKR